MVNYWKYFREVKPGEFPSLQYHRKYGSLFTMKRSGEDKRKIYHPTQSLDRLCVTFFIRYWLVCVFTLSL